MDTGIEYIEMCKKSKNVQEEWSASCGDFVYRSEYDVFEIYTSRELINAIHSSSYIWLPRQDQLQDMSDNISDKGLFFWSLSNCAEGWLCVGRDIAEQMIYPREERYLIGEDYSETAEQALLKMYIGIGCNKTWNGKGWIDDRTKVI